MRYTSTHPHRQGTNAESCSVKTKGGEPPALSEGRPSLTKEKGKLRAFESQMCILRRRRNLSHEHHVADRGFHSWHHDNLACTPVPISKATKIPSDKIASLARLEDISLQEGWEKRKRSQLKCLYFHRHTELFLSANFHDQNFWTKSQLSLRATDQLSVFDVNQQRRHRAKRLTKTKNFEKLVSRKSESVKKPQEFVCWETETASSRGPSREKSAPQHVCKKDG